MVRLDVIDSVIEVLVDFVMNFGVVVDFENCDCHLFVISTSLFGLWT